ncbi:MAG: hypothetical protein ACOH2V_01035 [Candidatus Saccharimonadaceae bacterium]
MKKLKDAEEYLEQIHPTSIMWLKGLIGLDGKGSDYKKLLNCIKQAQIDAIEAAVERCAEEADTKDEGFYDGEQWHHHDIISEETILSVAYKMKEELNDTY